MRDVMELIWNGEIIEQYPEDFPVPSCLVLGFTVRKRALHAVLSTDGTWIYLITAYYPSSDEWEEDMKTRKRRIGT